MEDPLRLGSGLQFLVRFRMPVVLVVLVVLATVLSGGLFARPENLVNVARQISFEALIAFGMTLIYLAWRFEWRFSVAAVLATVHDIVATMAFMKYMNLEITLFVVGAVLTVIGYSMNDKVVVFDRELSPPSRTSSRPAPICGCSIAVSSSSISSRSTPRRETASCRSSWPSASTACPS